MDYIRAPYRRSALLCPDGNTVVTLRWYPAPAGAKVFPYWHRFASGDWSVKGFEFIWPGVGELKSAKRTWWKGSPVEQYKGQCFIGPVDWYQNGVPSAALNVPVGKPPLCCLTAADEGSSGPSLTECQYLTSLHRQVNLQISGAGPYDDTYTIGYNTGLGYYLLSDQPVPGGQPISLAVSCNLGPSYGYPPETLLVNVGGGLLVLPAGFLNIPPGGWDGINFNVTFSNISAIAWIGGAYQSVVIDVRAYSS